MNPQDPQNPQQPAAAPQQPAPPVQQPQPQQPQTNPTLPQPDQTQQIHNPLAVMQSGERTICEIKRHPIGLVGIYAMIGFVLVVLAVVAFGVVPSVASNQAQAMGVAGLAYVIIAILCLGFVFIANKIYWGNRWILTTDSITQVTQTGLFSKQSSQLSLGNLEDITAEQNGILTHMFNYGLIKAETAGERSKFVFLYCPNPSHYAREVLNAREQFEQSRSGETSPAAN